MVNEKTILNLSLELNEINLIIVALSKQPYDQVYSLIDKIKQQGSAQVQELEKETSEESKK